MCGGCAYCSDAQYLSEDSEDSYFLHGPENFDIRSRNASSLDKRDIFHMYYDMYYDMYLWNARFDD